MNQCFCVTTCIIEIIFSLHLDSFFYYTAVVGVSHLRLPWWAEPFAGN